MDALMLARWQFGITTIYHFFFVPLTLGLSLLVAIFQTAYVRTDSDTYKRMTQFWGKLFLINFAMGVVTGIVQEFQFGMNWSEYSRFVGDIFGAPLAIEALLAFFLESTFVGVWIFGWGRLNKRLHLASIWLVVVGSNISALWILIANSFMQQPVGYTLRNGRAEMTDFGALLTNPNLWVQWPHVFTAGVATASFFVIGISAWHLLRKKGDLDLFRKSASIAMATAIIASMLVALVGHTQAQHMVQTQPMKMASAEALWNSESPASFSIFTIGDENANKDVFAIRLPTLLSILSYNNTSGEVKGINDLQTEYEKTYGPGDYIPPVWVVYWSFRAMVGAGGLMIVLSLYGLYLVISRKLSTRSWYLKLMLVAMALPYIANSSGWIMTEIGRQPWIVFGLMTTEKGVSTAVGAESVLISVVIFTLLYGALAVVDVYLLAKYARDDASAKPENSEEADLVGAY
ncbi:MAG: cytochrome ubiquinol oxidase subunit I [Chloroflexi bacterium]|uniref:Cytochrome ubiquinol oxidase subunit I n=1 Tax=Candidatus Chlorohelix allophototropha TaxID=3003348 RepID=A0A8T7M0J4_9CHLR|nr:cytochrome ubiquinol oxidase subunit I [Chloroflexota bacterium]WJW67232.1 cytochrome ubiquinol oxidase subunit I [Chloroflexota bacterium L227-S17]